MNTLVRRIPAAAIATLVLLAAPSIAADKKETADNVVTIYISGHLGDSIAKETNRTHAKMEAAGWRFANFEVHMENGDTKGAWITYTK